MRIKIMLLLSLICVIDIIFVQDVSAAMYKYLDKNGLICISNDLQSIPEQYRASAEIVSGEQKQEQEQRPAIPNQSAVQPSAENRESVPAAVHDQLRTQPIEKNSFIGSWLLSAIIVVSAVFVFLILGTLDMEHKKSVTIARIVIIWCVTIFLLYAHGRDAVRFVQSVNGTIEDVEKQSAEKGRKTAEAMKKINELMSSTDNSSFADQADAQQEKKE